MRLKKKQRLFTVVLSFPNQTTRSVKVKAADRETAERRALKHNPYATGVHRHG